LHLTRLVVNSPILPMSLKAISTGKYAGPTMVRLIQWAIILSLHTGSRQWGSSSLHYVLGPMRRVCCRCLSGICVDVSMNVWSSMSKFHIFKGYWCTCFTFFGLHLSPFHLPWRPCHAKRACLAYNLTFGFLLPVKYNSEYVWNCRLKKYKAARLEVMFPDEIDTPSDKLARVRFQKWDILHCSWS
jgi:hypothetical protein